MTTDFVGGFLSPQLELIVYFLLFFDIFLDCLFVRSNRTHKVPSCPKVPSYLCVLLHYLPAASSFQPFHQFADRHIRRHRDQQMNVTRPDRSTQNLDIQLQTRLTEQIPNPFAHRSCQYRLAILGYPDQVVLQIVGRMGGFSITHPSIIHPPVWWDLLRRRFAHHPTWTLFKGWKSA